MCRSKTRRAGGGLLPEQEAVVVETCAKIWNEDEGGMAEPPDPNELDTPEWAGLALHGIERGPKEGEEIYFNTHWLTAFERTGILPSCQSSP
jgi:hypothetical protein